MIYTTLNRIRERSPCTEGWEKLLKSLNKTKADDEPLPLAAVLESNGLDDALWCLRAEPQHSNPWRLLAVKYARRVQHLMTDPRSLNALDVAERHAHGQATDEELASARAAAEAAAWEVAEAAAWAARVAARAAAWDAARAAAWDAARAAAWDAARAARVAARAAAWDAARDAAWDSARAAAWDAAREQQAADLLELLAAYEAAPGATSTTTN